MLALVRLLVVLRRLVLGEWVGCWLLLDLLLYCKMVMRVVEGIRWRGCVRDRRGWHTIRFCFVRYKHALSRQLMSVAI